MDRETNRWKCTHTYVRTDKRTDIQSNRRAYTHTTHTHTTRTQQHTHTHTATHCINSIRAWQHFCHFHITSSFSQVEGKVKLNYAKPGQTKAVYRSTSAPASATPSHKLNRFNNFWLEMSLFTNIAKFRYLLFWRL